MYINNLLSKPLLNSKFLTRKESKTKDQQETFQIILNRSTYIKINQKRQGWTVSI